MKIINTIKNYFKSSENKINLSYSSSDNILLKQEVESLDLKLKEHENLIQGLINYTKTRYYKPDTSENENLGAGEFDIIVTNNIVNMSGRIIAKTDLSGQYYMTLPSNFRPKADYVGYWTTVIVDGVEYKFHIQVDRTYPNRLNIYSYDTFPSGSSIVFQLTYPLDNGAN